MLRLRIAGPDEAAPDPFDERPSGVHVWFNRHGGVVARGFRDGGFYWMAWPHLATYRFAAGDPFITAHVVSGAPSDVVWDVYRRSVMPMALQVLGWEALHASSIVCSRGVVAFCAVSETGKSTLAFGLRQRGFPQWSDDGVVFRTDGRVVASPLPFEARLRPESLALFGIGATAGLEENRPGEQQFTDDQPLALLCLLTRVEGPPGAAPAIRAVAPADAFPQILVHAHEFDPYDPERRARMMQAYLDLVAQVPVREVQFVPNRSRVDDLLDCVIEGLGLEPPPAGTSSR